MTESCAACRFFHDLAPELEVRKVKGRKDLVTTVCRRYPKSVGKYPTAWCGEFRRRPHGNALNAAELVNGSPDMAEAEWADYLSLIFPAPKQTDR